MAELIKCFECGAEVSSAAPLCPKCKNPPYGYMCRICYKIEKKSALEDYIYASEYILYGNTEYKLIEKKAKVHSSCLNEVQGEYQLFVYNCQVCSHSWLLNEWYSSYCPSCGNPMLDNRSHYCSNCNLRLVDETAIKIEENGNELFFHKLCAKHRGYKRDIAREKKNIDKCQIADQSCKSPECFIATTLYGEDSSKVQMLCFFRDEYLAASSLGRAFIVLYVRLSPPLARAIAKEYLLRSLVRSCIVAPALLFTEKFLAYVGRKGNSKI